MHLRRCTFWLGLLLLMFPSAKVHAHPFQDGLAGHKVRVVVDSEQVRADVLVEEPVPWVLRDLRAFLADVPSPSSADQERYTARRLTEFEDGFQLYVEGKRVDWKREPWEGANGVGDRQFVVFGLTLLADLPPAPNEIRLHLLDINHDDQKVAQWLDVWSDASVDVRGCSLWRSENGALIDNRAGQWAAGEKMREVRLTVVRQSGWMTWWNQLGRRAHGVPSGPQPMGAKGEQGPVRETVIALLFLFMGAIGFVVRKRNRKRFSADVDSRRDVQ